MHKSLTEITVYLEVPQANSNSTRKLGGKKGLVSYVDAGYCTSLYSLLKEKRDLILAYTKMRRDKPTR